MARIRIDVTVLEAAEIVALLERRVDGLPGADEPMALGERAQVLMAEGEFETIHPGGHKIIESYSGMDATSNYHIVGHNLDPEVEAMLAMYEIRRDATAGPRLPIRHRGRRERLEHLSLDELYRRWVRHLYSLAKISNAHRIDVSVSAEPLRRSDRDGTRLPTAYRLQLGIESHARFLAQTVPMVCRRFAALWRTTSGPCCAGESFQALVRELEQVLASPAALAALAGAQALERTLENGVTAELPERLAALTAADAGYLDAVTMLARSGVKVFETYERDVLAHGSEELLAAVRAFPALTHDHFEAIAGSGEFNRPAAGH